MKNALPLVLAVLLGLAAVLSVNRTLAQAKSAGAKTLTVIAATTDVSEGKDLASHMLGRRNIQSSSYLPGHHILDSQKDFVEGLKARHAVKAGSLLLYDDLDTGSGGQSDNIGEHQFGVAVKFQSSPLMPYLKPNDEIAIAAMQDVPEAEETGKTNDKEAVRTKYVRKLSVLFPRVKIRDVANGAVLVSADPEEALRLLMASQNMALYPLLLRRGGADGDSGPVEVKPVSLEDVQALPFVSR